MNSEPLDQYMESQKKKFRDRQKAIARLAEALNKDNNSDPVRTESTTRAKKKKPGDGDQSPEREG